MKKIVRSKLSEDTIVNTIAHFQKEWEPGVMVGARSIVQFRIN